MAKAPVVGGLIPQTSCTVLTVYWKRATGAAESAPTVDKPALGSHVRAGIITVRGCRTTGLPWDDVQIKESAAVTTTPALARATPIGEALLLMLISNSGFITGSGWANPNLTNIIEQVDSNDAVGNGSGFMVVTGEANAAGDVGETSGSFSASGHYASLTLALTANGTDNNDYIPYIAGVGTPAELAAAGSISPAWPPHAAGDIGLLVVESGGWPIDTPAGWTHVTDSPQNAGTSGATSGTSLNVFWKRAAGGAEAAPSIAFVADHIRGQIFTVKGAIASGDPFNAADGNADATNISTVTWPSISTTKNNCLVLCIASHSRDGTGNPVESGQNRTNGNLQDFTRPWDIYSGIGNGSGIIMFSGKLATAGSTGNPTVLMDGTSNQGRLTLAIQPVVQGNTLNLEGGTMAIVASDMAMQFSRKLNLDSHSMAIVGGDMVISAPFRNYLFDLESGSLEIEGGEMSMRKTIDGWVKDGSVESDWVKDDSL